MSLNPSAIRDLILDVPNFPKPGILFRDITPLLSSPGPFSQAITAMASRINPDEIDIVAGIESRGFILGSAIALKLGKGFVPIRKKGKLPPPVKSQSYMLEYGQDVLEIKPGSGRVLLVDDVLATGGTIKAAISLCETAGYKVVDLAFLINLKHLNQFSWNALPVHAVVEYVT